MTDTDPTGTIPPTTHPDPGDTAGDVVYHGSHTNPAGAGPVWLERAAQPGVPIGTLTHRTAPGSHSPTGFSWGYGGSGPAELAFAMLRDAVRSIGEGKCDTCAGGGRVVLGVDGEPEPYDPDRHGIVVGGDDADLGAEGDVRCWDCEGTGDKHLPYQQFKWDVVAGLDDTWELPRAEVIAWYRTHTAATGAGDA